MINKRKRKKKPDVIITCSQCGVKYKYEKFEDLDEIDINTPCNKCGFLLHRHILNKMEAMTKLASNDQYAQELLKKSNYKELNKYLEMIISRKNIEPIV